MKYQQVSVDLVNMMMTACSYLALAGAAWVFLRLLQACFWLPRHLRKQNNVQKLLQDKVDNYEKYLAECEARDKLEDIKEKNSNDSYENLEKFDKQRECLELLKKELNKVKEGVNVSDWDYLLEENQNLVIDSPKCQTVSEEETVNDLSKEQVVPKKEELLYQTNNEDTKDDADNDCEKKDN